MNCMNIDTLLMVEKGIGGGIVRGGNVTVFINMQKLITNT